MQYLVNICIYLVNNIIRHMKKELLTLLFVVALTNLSGFSQVTFGVKGGLNVTSLSCTDEGTDINDRCGFFFGPTAKMSLPLGFSVDGSVLYDQRSSKVETLYRMEPPFEKKEKATSLLNKTSYLSEGAVNYPTTIKQQQIVVPVNLRYGTNSSKPFAVYLFAGPQLGFNIGDKSITTDEDDWDFKTVQLSMNFGAGMTLCRHLQISANYNLACTKSTNLVINKSSSLQTVGSGKLNAWQISLGYFF